MIPRPPGWETNRRILAARRWWHRCHLPCPFCLLEGRYEIRRRIAATRRRLFGG